MADDLITLIVDGSDARQGAIPADAFIGKLRAFMATLYGLDRAFTRHNKRQFDLEIVELSRNSPANVGMRPRADTNGYDPHPSIEWGFAQLERLRAGEDVDAAVTQPLMDNVIELARVREGRLPELGFLRANYRTHSIPLDATLGARAMAARALRVIDAKTPWRASVSYGTVMGELRGVMDLDGEHQFYIVPPTGPKRIACNFPEDLRAQMNESLFKTIRASGYLHYDGQSPFPRRLDADTINGMRESVGHFSDLRGIFKGLPESDFGDVA